MKREVSTADMGQEISNPRTQLELAVTLHEVPEEVVPVFVSILH